MLKKRKKRKKSKELLTTEQITIELLSQLMETQEYYTERYTYHLNFHRKNRFIYEILYDVLNDIINSMDNNIYTFKYQIFNEYLFWPQIKFMTKDELKKNISFIHKINQKKYKNIPFGIRLEFIDTEAYRISYIITIDL